MTFDYLSGSASNMMFLADDRMAIGCVFPEEQWQNRFVLPIERRIFVAIQLGNHRAFFLAELMFVVDSEVPHAVGFNVECYIPAVRRKVKVITGQFLTGPGVVSAATALCLSINIAGHQSFRALEHQMFEIMR